MIPAAVEYRRAASLDEAFAALADPDARALAGGQSLISVLKLRIVQPTLLVDIGRLGLSGVALRDGAVRIGALTVWGDLAGAKELGRPALAAIAECASVIGDLQVRNRGTIGGSLAHADPASDIPATLLALGASVELRSAGQDRTVPLADFLLGPFLTALGPAELITEIVVALPPAGSGSAYVKFEHPASGFALAGAAALVRADGSRTVAVTGVGARPFLLPDGDPDTELVEEVFGDGFASEEYRRHVVAVAAKRAVELAQVRAEEDEKWQA